MTKIKTYYIFLLLFIVLSNSTSAQHNNVINHSSNILIASINDLENIRLLYNVPNLLHPKLIFGKDTLDISQYVKVSLRNRDVLRETENHPENYKRSAKNVSLNNHIAIKNYLICLSDVVIGKDIVIWKKQDTKYSLLAIYPSEIGVCLYCGPQFYITNIDTFSIGNVIDGEGDVYGGYSYYTIEYDTLHLTKTISISGSSPIDGRSNPIDSATCIGFITINYSNNGIETSSSIRYECKYINGKDINGYAVNDSLSLYKMYWQGIGPLLRRVKTSKEKLRVGLSIYHEGYSYIAIEYEDQWYWALYDKIKIE